MRGVIHEDIEFLYNILYDLLASHVLGTFFHVPSLFMNVVINTSESSLQITWHRPFFNRHFRHPWTAEKTSGSDE